MSDVTEVTETARDLVIDHAEADASWIKWAALSAMIMALFAAIASLFASMTANESVLERTEEILEVSYLENDRVRVEVLRSKHEILTALSKPINQAEVEEIRVLETEIKRLRQAVEEEEAKVQFSAFTHEIFAIGITLLSVAITLSGMAIVSARKFPWIAGMALGVVGCGFAIFGLIEFF